MKGSHAGLRLGLLLGAATLALALTPWAASSFLPPQRGAARADAAPADSGGADAVAFQTPAPVATFGPWQDISETLPEGPFEPGRVKMTSPVTAWITSRSSALLYRWSPDGIITIPVPGREASYELGGLHAVSEDVVWIVANPKDCRMPQSSTPFIARYDAEADDWTFYELASTTSCGALHDIWVNSEESFGYAGGGFLPPQRGSLWLTWRSGGVWTQESTPHGSAITDLDLDALGRGYVGFSLNDCFQAPCTSNTAIMRFDNGTFTPASTERVMNVMEINGEWAVGQGTTAGDTGPKIYQRGGDTWDLAPSSESSVSYGHYLGVAVTPASDLPWVVGLELEEGAWKGVLATPGPSGLNAFFLRDFLRDADFSGEDQGLVVGDGILLRYETVSAAPDGDDFRSPSSKASLFAAGLGLFSRLQTPRILQQKTRERVHEAIRQQPWTDVSGLREATGMSSTGIRHHLRILLSHEKIVQRRFGRTMRFAIPTSPTTLPPLDSALLRGSAVADVMEQVAGGPQSQAQLVKFLRQRHDYERSAAWRLLKRAAQGGLLVRERRESKIWYSRP